MSSLGADFTGPIAADIQFKGLQEHPTSPLVRSLGTEWQPFHSSFLASLAKPCRLESCCELICVEAGLM
jgi:hypothetical protein